MNTGTSNNFDQANPALLETEIVRALCPAGPVPDPDAGGFEKWVAWTTAKFSSKIRSGFRDVPFAKNRYYFTPIPKTARITFREFLKSTVSEEELRSSFFMKNRLRSTTDLDSYAYFTG